MQNLIVRRVHLAGQLFDLSWQETVVFILHS